MLESWTQMLTAMSSLTLETLVLRLITAQVMGGILACIYQLTRPRHDPATRGFIATIVLLSLLLAMVVIIVGDNFARAFSLAGVLAIVRFRTVVEDTRDSAFVICAVVIGMAAGAGFLAVALVGLPLIALTAYLTQPSITTRNSPVSSLKIRTGLAADQQTAIDNILRKYADSWTINGSATARQGAALDFDFQLRLKPDFPVADLVRELNKLEGIQEVEWKA